MHPQNAQEFYAHRDKGKMLKRNMSLDSSLDFGPSPKRRHFEGSLSKRLFNGLFEKVLIEQDRSGTPKVIAKCLLCTHKQITIRAAMGVTSNFITHLRRKHPVEYENCYMKGQVNLPLPYAGAEYENSFMKSQEVAAPSNEYKPTAGEPDSSLSELIWKNNRSRKSIFNHYFTKLQDDQKKIIAVCNICNQAIKSSAQVTSNYIRHLKIKHTIEYSNFYKNQQLDRTFNSEQDDENDDEVDYDDDDDYEQFKNLPLETVVKEEPQAFQSFYFNEAATTQPVVNPALLEPQQNLEESNLEKRALEQNIIKEEIEETMEQDAINADTINNLIDSLNVPPNPIDIEQQNGKSDETLLKPQNGKISLFNGIYTEWRKSIEENKMIANCLLCGALIQGNLKITSNFISHLKRKHPQNYIQYHNSKIKGIADAPNGSAVEETFDNDTDGELDSSNNSTAEQDLNYEYRKSTGVEKFFERLHSTKKTENENGKISSPRVCFARCRVCKKVLRGVDKVSSNYLQHLRRKHPAEYAEYTSSKNSSTDQTKFENDIVDFVIQTGQSLNIVENLYFKKLFEDRLYFKMPTLNEVAELARTKGYFMPTSSTRNERQQFANFTF